MVCCFFLFRKALVITPKHETNDTHASWSKLVLSKPLGVMLCAFGDGESLIEARLLTQQIEQIPEAPRQPGKQWVVFCTECKIRVRCIVFAIL